VSHASSATTAFTSSAAAITRLSARNHIGAIIDAAAKKVAVTFFGE
jgi:hypothetical protein